MKDRNFEINLTDEQISDLSKIVKIPSHWSSSTLRKLLKDIWKQVETNYLAFLEEEKEIAAKKEAKKNAPIAWEEQDHTTKF